MTFFNFGTTSVSNDWTAGTVVLGVSLDAPSTYGVTGQLSPQLARRLAINLLECAEQAEGNQK
jgi:hypothetical protein